MIRYSRTPDKAKLEDPELVYSDVEATWCRSVIGGLFYYARGTRWDVSHTLSRIAQTNQNPTVGKLTLGTVKALEWLASYLLATSGGVWP